MPYSSTLLFSCVCVCNQNWIEKKLVAMFFCNTNAQKCDTSVKKLIAQKKQSTLCHRCHLGVSCTRIYLFLSVICGLHGFNIR